MTNAKKSTVLQSINGDKTECKMSVYKSKVLTFSMLPPDSFDRSIPSHFQYTRLAFLKTCRYKIPLNLCACTICMPVVFLRVFYCEAGSCGGETGSDGEEENGSREIVPLFVFADIEAMQENGIHTPNLLRDIWGYTKIFPLCFKVDLAIKRDKTECRMSLYNFKVLTLSVLLPPDSVDRSIPFHFQYIRLDFLKTQMIRSRNKMLPNLRMLWFKFLFSFGLELDNKSEGGTR